MTKLASLLVQIIWEPCPLLYCSALLSSARILHLNALIPAIVTLGKEKNICPTLYVLEAKITALRRFSKAISFWPFNAGYLLRIFL